MASKIKISQCRKCRHCVDYSKIGFIECKFNNEKHYAIRNQAIVVEHCYFQKKKEEEK